MEFTTEDHWKFIAEFSRWELKAGGPDPHMVLSGEMSRDVSLDERFWRGGCYIAVYNAPFAEIIWREWTWERMQMEPEGLMPWLEAAFAKKRIVTRRERRCVRRADWMHEYLTGYAMLMTTHLPRLREQFEGRRVSDAEVFDAYWAAVLSVPRIGRYVAIKLLEYYRRYCDVKLRHYDIRAKDGWSPREMLGYLWPGHPNVTDRKDNSSTTLAQVDRLAAATQKRLKEAHGVELDMFQLQVMLCDYKQSWKGMRQYPGRSIDSELTYVREAEELWGHKSTIWEARKRVFPAAQLGELNGWPGVRKELGEVLALHGYTWSDQLYSYSDSVGRLDRPVLKKGKRK